MIEKMIDLQIGKVRFGHRSKVGVNRQVLMFHLLWHISLSLKR